jgi:hypothetical protein
MWFLVCWWAGWAVIAIIVGIFYDGGDVFAGVVAFLIGGVLCGLFVVMGIWAHTDTIDKDQYSLVSNEKVYYNHDSPQNDQHIKVMQLFGGTGTGDELMIDGPGDDEIFPISSLSLSSISVSTDNEFYLQKITRHLDRGWFNFASTSYESNLVIPKNLNLEISQ